MSHPPVSVCDMSTPLPSDIEFALAEGVAAGLVHTVLTHGLADGKAVEPLARGVEALAELHSIDLGHVLIVLSSWCAGLAEIAGLATNETAAAVIERLQTVRGEA